MPHRLFTVATYFASQVALFFRLLFTRGIPRRAVVYVNTVLPFGAALYGRMTGRPVIYHLHEVSVTPAALKSLLLALLRLTASRVIYVSHFHEAQLPIEGVPGSVIYNALPHAFVRGALGAEYSQRHDGIFRVLMLASLRDYKGIPEFLEVARSLQQRADIAFQLVCNDTPQATDNYFATRTLPPNVVVCPATSHPEEHYRRASLVVNLSRPDLWEETFGLTVAEAMAFGVPVIVPPIGGPAEIVTDGREGLQLDCRRIDEVASAIRQLADDPQRCLAMSRNARAKAQQFSEEAFAAELHAVIGQLK
jgi:glycosyltransferase involved in cell wall biosynthesis